MEKENFNKISKEKLIKAKRISGHWPGWLDEKVKTYIKQGFSGTKLVKKILDENGVIIRTKGIRKRIREMKKNEK